MVPVIALVGRPNVGKSTMFNRLTRTRDALVANYAGLTRDRKYGDGEMNNRKFIVIDTGGISGDEEGIDSVMAEQSLLAVEEADVVIFMVDSRDGLTSADSMIADHLRINNKKAYLVANKIDGQNHDVVTAAFYELGLGNVYGTTATQGRGVKSLMDIVLSEFDENIEDFSNDQARGIKMAIVGRPNVGKSTLVNRLLGEDRVVVYDQPGTTRDSVYINYQRNEKDYTIIDTAGIRRRKNVKESIEKFSIVKTLQAISDANVVVLLIDASEGLVDQDLHLMGHILDAGRALVVGLNKWDGLQPEHKDFIKSELERRLRFIDFADIHFISALHGTGVGSLYGSIEQAYSAATDKLTTNHLTRILHDAVTTHQPPLVGGHRIKLRYAHAGGRNPPLIIIHGNQTESVPAHYKKFLEKTFRKALDLHGTPIKMEFKSTDNPYAKGGKGQNEVLTSRQEAKQRRLQESKKHQRKKT